MKPAATLDPKNPGEPAQAMAEGKTDRDRGSSTLWLALVMLLVVCVVVGGFLGAFYMFKESSLDAEDFKDQINEFLESSREKQEEIINYNIRQQNTLNEEKDGGRKQRIYHDFQKGLTVLVDDEEATCFLYPPDQEKLEQEILEDYLEDHPDPDGLNDTGAELRPHDEELEDRSLLGPAISAMCKDKQVFWLYPNQDEDDAEDEEEEEEGDGKEGEEKTEEEGEGTLSRTRRATRGHHGGHHRRCCCHYSNCYYTHSYCRYHPHYFPRRCCRRYGGYGGGHGRRRGRYRPKRGCFGRPFRRSYRRKHHG